MEVRGAPPLARAVSGRERRPDRRIRHQGVGLEHLGDRAGRLRDRFADIDHPGAREIVNWLDGHWKSTGEDLEA